MHTLFKWLLCPLASYLLITGSLWGWFLAMEGLARWLKPASVTPEEPLLSLCVLVTPFLVAIWLERRWLTFCMFRYELTLGDVFLHLLLAVCAVVWTFANGWVCFG